MVTLVSVLSSENVWLAMSRRREEDVNRLEEVKKRFANQTDMRSDHMVLVKLYEEWNSLRGREGEWCYKNFVQSRALKQAKNIIAQLQDYIKGVDFKKLGTEVEDFSNLKGFRKDL